MKVRILGCSGGIGKGLRTTSLLIDDDILIDAGTGVGDLTIEEMVRIRHIFLSHSHLDHINSIPLLVDSIFDFIDQPLIIHGLEQTLSVLRKHVFNWDIWPDFAQLPHPEKPVMAYEAFVPGDVVALGDRKLEAIAVNHIVPGVGYRVECPSGSFAFSGDTTTNDSLWEALNKHDSLDFLMVEAAFENANLKLSQLARHYCPQLLAVDLAKLRHKADIYLTHFNPGKEDTIFEECQQAMPELDLKRLSGGEVFDI